MIKCAYLSLRVFARSTFSLKNSPVNSFWCLTRSVIAAEYFSGFFGGTWSSYYYNGYIYSNDIQKGFDVFELRDKRTDSARKVRMTELNPQAQTSFSG